MTDTVTLSKAALKEQADLILADNAGMSIDEAYGKALAHMIACQCEDYAVGEKLAGGDVVGAQRLILERLERDNR